MALILGGIALGVIVLIIALVSGGGGSSHSSASGAGAEGAGSATSTNTGKTHSKSSTHHASANVAGAASPAEISVAVLNATETTGLAHHVAGELVQLGYSKAVALGGRPAGADQVTVVEYASGHQAEASAVAHSLGVATVQPMEAGVASLAGSASVAVKVGLDKAGSVP